MTDLTGSTKAICIGVKNGAGVLKEVDTIFAENNANITTIHLDLFEAKNDGGTGALYIEYQGETEPSLLLDKLNELPSISEIKVQKPFVDIFGKRVIIIGGGAQVAQVALGAVNEADRHNIRGEKISVDTIPLVGEETIAQAVETVLRLKRASILVLAGSLMGGKISKAVDKVRAAGIPVITSNMAGTVPEHADLVVSDPIQAGVFAVMQVSNIAVFDIKRVRGRKF